MDNTIQKNRGDFLIENKFSTIELILIRFSNKVDKTGKFSKHSAPNQTEKKTKY